jgi:hypothetical protein
MNNRQFLDFIAAGQRHRKKDGAESLVDTSIRRRPYDDAEVTEVQVQV